MNALLCRMAFWICFYLVMMSVGLIVLAIYDPTQYTTLNFK